LPPEFEELSDVALDLRWTGSQFLSKLWSRFDADAWERSRNPYTILANARQSKIAELQQDQELVGQLKNWLERRDGYFRTPGWFPETHPDSALKCVAYFSMEFGLSEALPIYSGGLGMLAGDHLKAASDLDVPLIGIGLLYQQGYFHQLIGADGEQLEAFPYNDPSSLPITPVHGPDGRWPRVRLELPGRTLFCRIWQAKVGKVTLYLLDSNDPLNHPWDRGITANLYAAGEDKRLLQEIVLGVGGWRLLQLMGIKAQVCHLNEGHAAFAIMARAAEFARDHGVDFETALEATRAGNVFTTHTPVEAAFDKFPGALLMKYACPIARAEGIPLERVVRLGRSNPADDNEPFNMAYFALRGSGRVNGVSRLHGEVSRGLFSNLFPGRPVAEVPVDHVTNGVHVPSWDSDVANKMWRTAMDKKGWQYNLAEAAEGFDKIGDVELWNHRGEARHTLVEYVRRRLGRQLRERNADEDVVERARHMLDPNTLTFGFARRFTAYKRPNMLLHDPERLARILCNPDHPAQLIVAGKAHPRDTQGKGMVQAMARFAFRDDVRDRVVFLEDYDMALAQQLAGGVDVWLNTPRRPAEACGTSGMKMLVNGGLNLSERDGWWDEAYSEDVGWAVGDGTTHAEPEWDDREAEHLYWLIEQQIVPEFYDVDEEGVPKAWVRRVRNSISRLTPRFSADRMVREYVEDDYIPAAQAFGRRSDGGAKLAAELIEWRAELERDWQSMRFTKVTTQSDDEKHHFDVQIYFGELDPKTARVELYAEGEAGGPPEVIVMEQDGAIPGTFNGFHFRASVSNQRPAAHYTPRVVPWHPEAAVPMEAKQILWYHPA